LGLTRVQRFRLIVFPQAIRTILPPLGNDFVAMVKDSSLVSVLGVADITQMAKLYASEMAGRVADRALQIFGGRGYMHENAAARFYRELRVDRIWEGTSEIQRLIISNGLFKRGAAPYLGWE